MPESWNVVVPHSDLTPHLIECNSDTASLDSAHAQQNQLSHLYETLISCPKISSLSLDIQEHSSWLWSQLFLPFRSGDRFPNITELKVLGYPWDVDSRQIEGSWWHSSSWFDHFTPVRGDVTAWKAAMDWSRLKKLDIDRPSESFLEAFQGKLKAVESFTLRPKPWDWKLQRIFSNGGKALEELKGQHTSFIASLPPLKELQMNDMASIINMTEILEIHGPSLESLALRGRKIECWYGHCRRVALGPISSASPEDFKLLTQSAPKLERLELDLATGPGVLTMEGQVPLWVSDFLDGLRSLAKLKTLTLYFKEQIKEEPQCAVRWRENCVLPKVVRPVLDERIALDIFRKLRRVEDGTGEHLERLTLHADVIKERRHLTFSHLEPDSSLRWLCSVDVDGREEYHDAGRKVERRGPNPNDVVQLAGLIEAGPANIQAQTLRVPSGWARRYSRFGVEYQ